MTRVQLGGFCIKGGGHIWTHEEGADGCSGWELYIDLDPEDVHLFPDWVQDAYRVDAGLDAVDPASSSNAAASSGEAGSSTKGTEAS